MPHRMNQTDTDILLCQGEAETDDNQSWAFYERIVCGVTQKINRSMCCIYVPGKVFY